MKIVLMGTSDFVIPSFKRLASEHEIIAVYTSAPKPCGRGNKIQKSEPHIWAEENNIPVETPKTLKNEETSQLIKEYAKKADIAVLSVYGLYIPTDVIKAFKYGIINIHPSLLPKYRGSSPIYSAVLNGDTETGVSIMQLDEGFDTGNVLSQKKINIFDNDTFGTIYNKLSEISADLISDTINNIDSISPIKQQDLPGEIIYTKKLTRDDEKINWNDDAKQIHNKIRGLNPIPKANSLVNGTEYKIIESRLSETEDNSKEMGEIIKVEKDGAIIKCGKGSVKIIKIQPFGKKIMAMTDFLRGTKQFKGFDK